MLGKVLWFVLLPAVWCLHQLKILGPKELASRFQDNHIRLAASAVGYTPRASSILGLLVLSSPLDACSEVQLQHDASLDHIHQFVLASSEGKCPMSTKARNIMAADGYVAIVGDSISQKIQKQSNKVNIPVMEIPEQDLKILTEFMQSNPTSRVFTKIEFGKVQVPEKSVELTVWMSSSQVETYKLISELRSFVQAQPEKVSFKVGYVTSQKALEEKKVQYAGCLSSGKYCAPEKNLDGKIQGKGVVQQDLRQIIISRKYPDAWWDYAGYWATQCLAVPDPFLKPEELKRCSYRSMIRAGIDPEEIESEYYASFRGPRHEIQDNEYLLEQRQQYILHQVGSNPDFIVNGKAVSNKTTDGVKKVVCQRQTPDYSSECQNYSSIFASKSSPVGLIVGIIVGLLLFMSGIMVLYFWLKRRKMKHDVESEVGRIVQQYHAYSKTLNKKDEGEAL